MINFLAALTVFVGVNVVPMDSERVLHGQAVTVSDNRIIAIGPIDEVEIPEGAHVVYGAGRWIVPGLIDSHVHIRAQDLQRYIDSGITTVRDLAGIDPVINAARGVERGAFRGPRIIFSSMLLDGPPPHNPQFSVVVGSAGEAGQKVAEQRQRGATWIKLYENLPRPTYDAIVEAARTRGMKVAGHVSPLVPIERAVEAQHSIEHLAGYDRVVTRAPWHGPFAAWIDVEESRFEGLARMSAAAGVWNCPTLRVYEILIGNSIGREAVKANRRAFVRALRDAGARIVAGTDAGYLCAAGPCFHEEIQELAAAGLTPYEILAASTSQPAVMLGLADRIGRIEVGFDAEFILVNDNPLENLATLRYPAGVMLRGEWIGMFERRRAASAR